METTFVSRAGEKLQYALTQFDINVKDLICADLGSSTGGFVDCLLMNGAKKVYSVDTSYGELNWNLRNDSRVVVMERTNALYVEFPEKVDFISIDVGWTKQVNILPKALSLLKENGVIVSLVKSHYEADKKMLHKGTVKEEFYPIIVSTLKDELKNLNINLVDLIESPIEGKRGKNKEYLFYIKK